MIRPTEADLLGWMSSLSNRGRWGSDDEKGTLNHITPATVARATGLVRTGEIVGCARPWNMSLPPTERSPFEYRMLEVADRSRPGPEEHRDFAHDHVGVSCHSMHVTHLDSLSHCSWGDEMYNGFPSHLVDEAGAGRLGVIAAAPAVVSRGILVDVPLLRGIDHLEPGTGMGTADLEAAARRCGVEPGPADVVLFRGGQPTQRSGPLPEVLPLLQEAQVAVVGSDTANDARPSGYPLFPNPFHQVALVAMGLWILDAAVLDDLAEACRRHDRWEFLFSMSVLPVPNATGSPVNPVAIF